MILCKTPETAEQLQAYYTLRWQVLRQPWRQPKGSEQDELESRSCHRMLVDENEQVLAVARYHQTGQSSAQVRYMAVSPTHQGQGLGKRLLLELERTAVQQGIRELTLNARESAIEFYQSLGYQNHGFHHLLYDEIKHYAMSKTLLPLAQHQLAQSSALEQLWHNTIPMSQAMNLNIGYYDQQQLVCHCDPDFNRNLHNTMFAGSIYTLATLTGWGWVYLQLQQQQLSGDIVLADASIRYLAPVAGPAYAKIEQHDASGNAKLLARGRKARINLDCAIYCGDLLCASFTGVYIVLPPTKETESETP